MLKDSTVYKTNEFYWRILAREIIRVKSIRETETKGEKEI